MTPTRDPLLLYEHAKALLPHQKHLRWGRTRVKWDGPAAPSHTHAHVSRKHTRLEMWPQTHKQNLLSCWMIEHVIQPTPSAFLCICKESVNNYCVWGGVRKGHFFVFFLFAVRHFVFVFIHQQSLGWLDKPKESYCWKWSVTGTDVGFKINFPLVKNENKRRAGLVCWVRGDQRTAGTSVQCWWSAHTHVQGLRDNVGASAEDMALIQGFILPTQKPLYMTCYTWDLCYGFNQHNCFFNIEVLGWSLKSFGNGERKVRSPLSSNNSLLIQTYCIFTKIPFTLPWQNVHTLLSVGQEVLAVCWRDYAGYVKLILLGVSDPYAQGVWA